MKKYMGFVGALFAAVSVQAYVNCYYLSDAEGGEGTWDDVRRWKDGVKPGDTDVVRLDNEIVRVTDDDWFFFQGKREILFSNNATLILDCTTNVTFSGVFQGSKGHIIKVNNNTFTCAETSDTIQLAGGEFIVSNGVFAIYSKFYPPSPSLFKVYKPGILSFSSTHNSYIAGLEGDGIVSNAVAYPASSFIGQLIFVGDRLNALSDYYVVQYPPYTFTGDFAGQVPITAGAMYTFPTTSTSVDYGAGEQYFASRSSTNMPYASPRFMIGLLKLAGLGSNAKGGGAVPSSVGNYDAFSFFCGSAFPSDTGFIYMGPGNENVNRAFDLYFQKAGSRVIADGGANGGLQFLGAWNNYTTQGTRVRPEGAVSRIVLRGSNTVANVINCAILEKCETNALAIIKQGTGTWRFKTHENRNNRGPIFVEKGTLEFESIAEAGSICSLGYATMLSTNWLYALDVPYVNYAYALGDGTNRVEDATATMAYVGEDVGVCTTRVFAVMGSGRVKSDAGKLHLRGAYAATPGVNSLILGGTGADNIFTDVTNGVGQLKVVKEDAGTWRLAGDVKLGGGVEVKAGVLRISNRYTWYRLNLRESLDIGTHASAKYNAHFGFGLFGMWDSEGHLLTQNFTEKSANATVTDLGVKETRLTGNCNVTYNTNGAGAPRGWRTGALNYDSVANELAPMPANLFRIKMNASADPNKYPIASDAATWPRYVMRFADDVQPIYAYDMRTEEDMAGPNRTMEMKSFSMDASADGLRWVEVSSVDDSTANGTVANGRWYSTRATTRGITDGFKLSASRDDSRAIEIASVSVASGATLDVEEAANVKVGGITFNAAAGGTLKGVGLNAEGALTIDEASLINNQGSTTFAMDLSNVTDLANIQDWVLSIAGKTMHAWAIRATAAGVTITPPGTVILVR